MRFFFPPTTWGTTLITNGWTGIITFPEHYFIVVPNILGNGFSSSPSNMSPPNDGPQFPLVTLYDNINLQHRLLTEQLGIEQLEMALGWSMSGQQAYYWGALHPSMGKRIVCNCGSARTSRHSFVFLEGLKAALNSSEDFRGGSYESLPVMGLRAVARVYAGWA